MLDAGGYSIIGHAVNDGFISSWIDTRISLAAWKSKSHFVTRGITSTPCGFHATD